MRCRLLIFIPFLFIGACANANWSSVFRTFSLDKSGKQESALVDAKQRAILSHGGKVCAEPSPDALSAVSNSVTSAINATDGQGREVGAKLALALREAASELGKRNATIQLLRDGLYRQCEAYMNGLVGPREYIEIADRYVDGMVTLLAIERLTAGGSSSVPEQMLAPNADTTIKDETGATTAKAADAGTPSVKVKAIDVGGGANAHNAKIVQELTENFLEKDLRSKCLGILIEQTSSSRNAPPASADSGFKNTDEITQIIHSSTTIAEVEGQRRAIARTEASIEETRKRLREANLNLQALYSSRDSEISNVTAGIADEAAKKVAIEKVRDRYWNRIYKLEEDIREFENQLQKFKEYLEIGHRALTTLETEYEKSRKLLRIHGFSDSDNPVAKAPLAVVNLERQITAEACAGILGVRNQFSEQNGGKDITVTTLAKPTQ